jgi:hypothetical protein
MARVAAPVDRAASQLRMSQPAAADRQPASRATRRRGVGAARPSQVAVAPPPVQRVLRSPEAPLAAAYRRQSSISCKTSREASRRLQPTASAMSDFSKVSIYTTGYSTGPAGSYANPSRVPAVRSLPPNLQAKLTIGCSDDPLEAEADKLAEQVTQSRGCDDSITPAITAMPPRVSRKCVECEQEGEHENTVRRKPTRGTSVDVGGAAPASVHKALRGPSHALDTNCRTFFESRLGYDLSNVRIHTDPCGADSAATVNAHAYTVGQDVVFGSGRYQPSTDEGRRLLAHELVHTIQQRTQPLSTEEPRNISRSPLQVSREDAPPSKGSKVGYVAVYLGGGIGEPHIVFHTFKGMVSYKLTDVGDLKPGEYEVGVTNRNGRVVFDFHNQPAAFHFTFDIKPGQQNPTTLFSLHDTVTFTVTDEEMPAPEAKDPNKKEEPRDPNTTYVSLEDGLRMCNAGELPGIKTFPYRGTRFGAAPLTVFREGGDIVVKSYLYVQQNKDFRAQTRTLPWETYVGGVHLKPDEIVRVHTYEPKWYQLNITGSTDGDVENEFCVTGEEMLAIGAKSDRDTIGNIALTVVDAATFFIPVGKIAGIIAKPVARGANALGISAMLALREVAPTAFAGIASRTGVVLVEEQAVDQFASRAVSKSVGHMLIDFGESRGGQAVASSAGHAVEGTAARGATEIASRTITVTVVDASGHQVVSTLTTPTGNHEVDRMVEEAFGRTFDQTLDPAATIGAGQGVVSVAPEIAAGFTEAHVRAFGRILAKPFNTADINILEQVWTNAARAGDQQILSATNARYLFDLQRNRFWRAVAANPQARALFEDAGCHFSGGAPYYLLNGRRIVITIDHILERQTMPQLALSAANLRLSFSRENSVVLRILTQKLAGLGVLQ